MYNFMYICIILCIYVCIYVYMSIYIYVYMYMGCLKKTRNQCQPRGSNFDHDGCAQMYSNCIAKDLLNNRPKTIFKYFSSLNNYRLAKICKPCGYVRDIPQHASAPLALENE